MRFVFLIVSVLALSACGGGTAGTIIRGENTHTSIGTGYEEMTAIKMANNAAMVHCEALGKQYAVDSIDTVYRGALELDARDNADTLLDVVGVVTGLHFEAGDNDDYKTIAIFHCI